MSFSGNLLGLIWALPIALPSLTAADAAGFSVDTGNREITRQFHLAVHGASDGAALDWTGSYTPGGWGSVAASSQESTLRRINYYRALAGVPATISLDATYSRKAQQAALMMSANKALNHRPPSNWYLYSAEGREAAEKSNLALGTNAAEAITGYICDPGQENADAGHRWWLLYPNTRTMGNGDVAGNATYPAANAVWVNDGQTGSFPVEMRANQWLSGSRVVCWPPVGYVPYDQVFARWSFLAESVDLRNATVTMKRSGLDLGVTIVNRPTSTGHGQFLVWVPEGMDASDPWYRIARPYGGTNTSFEVTISNVLAGGISRSYQYTVDAFDPAAPGANATVKAPDINRANARSNLTITAAPFPTETHDWRVLRRTLLEGLDNAESGLGRMVPQVSGYAPVVDGGAGGSAKAYVLGHGHGGQAAVPQYLEFGPMVVPGFGTILNFQSKLGFASVHQVARVQVSTNDGVSWSDIWTTHGTSELINSPSPTDTQFKDLAVKLDAYSSRSIRLRFAYTPGQYWFRYSEGGGAAWWIDGIRFTNSSANSKAYTVEILDGETHVGGEFTARMPTGDALFQARGRGFGDHPLEWGRCLLVQPTPANGSIFEDSPTSTGGWRFSAYGWIQDQNWPDVYFLEGGYGHVVPTGDPRRIYIFDYALESWVYTTEDMFPWIYSSKTNGYLYFLRGTTTPLRWYYSMPLGRWIREDAL